jgi:hypothetical protein
MRFCDRLWIVRHSEPGGPGPNRFDETNVTLLADGDIRLDVRRRGEEWTCAEVRTADRLGCGVYQVWLVGRVDLLDRQIVCGVFSYPTADVGPDGTHEIDIEFSRWGAAGTPCGNFTAWPLSAGQRPATHTFPVVLEGEFTTHRMVRRQDGVSFSSHHGHRDMADAGGLIAAWEFRGPVSQETMPLHLNFWLFEGKPPSDEQHASVTVRAFRFVPE